MRIGFGTDVHRYTDHPGKRLILAGFPVAGHKGVEADSDGDVALHALFNALSSALGGKSIGFYVNRMRSEGVTGSAQYLDEVLTKMREMKHRVNNVSLTFECVSPHIDPLIDPMKSVLSKLLTIDSSSIGITATHGDWDEDRIRVYAAVTVMSL